MRSPSVICFIFMLASSFSAFGQVPEQINYQAKVEVSGELITQTGVEVIFRLYDASASGTELYAETQTVDVVNGFYAVDLGASNAVPGSLATAIDNPEVWLEVEVDGSTLSPRERLVSVPFAIQAGSVVGGVDDGDANSANELNTSVAFVGNSLQVTDAGGTKSASLVTLLDNTDSQTLSFANPNLSISGGNSVDLSALSGGGGGGGGLAVIKPIDQTNGTTTLADDTHFVFALVPGTYSISAGLQFFGNANDAKFAMTFSGSATVSYFIDERGPTQSFGTVAPEITVSSAALAEELEGVIVVTAAGTLRIRYARFENADADGLTLRAGSYMVLTKLN